MDATIREPDSTREARSARNKLSAFFAILALLAVAGYLLFENLDIAPMPDYDGATHGINAYEMIRNDDYLVHTFGGETDYWNLPTVVEMSEIGLDGHEVVVEGVKDGNYHIVNRWEPREPDPIYSYE